ncbi:NUDIX hydrolase [Williamsia sterculiae]|uniref:NUDIX domain-containing protein n=1 Tax=Williamsia sterculiae TaxID=1344003 RepID=A0A1N7F422_9NOCA|nr:CoA pyrophosphatase [Williamsia sterculiae]SIR95130.1 NUDIX domain-containing protein [Williamsia sterculiae]
MTVVGPLVPADRIPEWLRGLTDDVHAVDKAVAERGGDRTRRLRSLLPTGDRRQAAVLVLFTGSFDADPDRPGGLPDDAELLLTERAGTLRNHSGQVAFPGGARDPGDDFPVGTALREATEETGLEAAGVTPIAVLDHFPVPPSGFDVAPVIGWAARTSPVRVVDEAETARVVSVRLSELLDPVNRFQVQRTVMGGRVYRGPAFLVDGLLVWGFTGGLLAAISATAGWDLPWDLDDIRDLSATMDSLRTGEGRR